MYEAIVTASSGIVLLYVVVFLVRILKNRDRLSSEVLWDRLSEKSRHTRLIVALVFFSLMMELLAETAVLLSVNSPYTALEDAFKIGEALNMILMAVAMLVAIPLLSAVSGGEEVAS